MSESYLDNPNHDDTVKEHPAFRRGKLKSTVFFLKLIKGAIDGSDPGDGEIGSPQIQAARTALLGLVESLEKATTKESGAALALAKQEVSKIPL
jgi:hypothetical protein